MSTLSHPIKAPKVALAYFGFGGVEVHAQGCRHMAKAEEFRNLDVAPSPEDPYADDYYPVAPCARKK